MSNATTTSNIIRTQDHSQDHMIFRMLLRIGFCPLYEENLRPQDMDRLGEEIATALQRCSVPESQITIGENVE
jgi:hypothetical protein